MTTRADKEYGGALYALAREEGLEDPILADCGLISAMLRENPDYVKLMSAPGIPAERKIALIEKAFAESVTPYTMNFLSLLGYDIFIKKKLMEQIIDEMAAEQSKEQEQSGDKKTKKNNR